MKEPVSLKDFIKVVNEYAQIYYNLFLDQGQITIKLPFVRDEDGNIYNIEDTEPLNERESDANE